MNCPPERLYKFIKFTFQQQPIRVSVSPYLTMRCVIKLLDLCQNEKGVDLICNSLILSVLEHLFICLIYSIFMNCLFVSFAHFAHLLILKLDCWSFSYQCVGAFYV